MKNIQLSWDIPADDTVTGYAIYHGPDAANLSLLANQAGRDSNLMIVYPDQLGYVDGDDVHLAVASINEAGESVKVPSNVVILPVPVPLPLPPTNVVAVLINQ